VIRRNLITYDDERCFVVRCLIDGVEVGRYETRVEQSGLPRPTG
jgi:hypothetical protein